MLNYAYTLVIFCLKEYVSSKLLNRNAKTYMKELYVQFDVFSFHVFMLEVYTTK